MKSFVATSLTAILFSTALLLPVAHAEDPGGMSESIMPPEDLEITDGGREKWLRFQSEEDGVLVVATHNSVIDLTIEIYSEEGVSEQLGHIDEDSGHVGNEVAMFELTGGEVVYIRVSPYSADATLPTRFHVLSSFVPGASMQHSMLRSSSYYRPAEYNVLDGTDDLGGIELFPR